VTVTYIFTHIYDRYVHSHTHVNAYAQVQDNFDEVTVCRIPNWPLFLDVVAIYKRKSITELIAQQGGVYGGDNMLSAFFSGAFDPFAGMDLAGDDFGLDEEEEEEGDE
jgi:hypothetical protein